jgi:hypothetical protein
LIKISSQLKLGIFLRLIFDSFLDGVEAPPLVGQVEGLEDQREGRVVTANALHGSLQRQEAMFLKIFIYGQFKFLLNYYCSKN